MSIKIEKTEFQSFVNTMLKNDKPEVIKRCRERRSHTPDFRNLKYNEYIPIFIYERIVWTGGTNNWLLNSSDTKYLGQAYSTTSTYNLRETLDGKYKIATKSEVEPAHLIGEVFGVSPITLLDIDAFYKNTDLYIREARVFSLYDQKTDKKIPTLKCWVYLGNLEKWHSDLRIRPRGKINSINKVVYLT